MSVLMIVTVSLDCKNLFVYSENNPITGKDSSGGVAETVFDVISLIGSVADVCCNPMDPWAWVGLVGDVADLIPFVTGLGEGVKGLRIVIVVADDAHDAKKAGEAVETAAEVVNKASNATDVSKAVGWKVGDPIDNLTKAGNEPSWSTVKSRYWKNEAYFNPDVYSSANLELMKKGNAPLNDIVGVPKELHHINGRNISNPHNINNLIPVWPWEHAAIDPYRFYTGPTP